MRGIDEQVTKAEKAVAGDHVITAADPVPDDSARPPTQSTAVGLGTSLAEVRACGHSSRQAMDSSSADA